LRAREGTSESSQAEFVRFMGGGVGAGLDGEQPMRVLEDSSETERVLRMSNIFVGRNVGILRACNNVICV
jgi:hypothetical protein